jgi:pimeloyl-ACP methyl ester carboxylesterase
MNLVRAIRVLAALWLLGSAGLAAASPEWVTVNHLSLRYELSGSGADTVVLMQESGKPLEIWDEILPSLSTPNRRVLRYDPRGVGLSEKFRKPTTMQDQVDDLRALMDALELRQPVVFLSGAFGGSVALQFAAQYPERVKGIAVTSPSALLEARPARPRIDPAVDPAGARAADERALKVTYPEPFRANEERWVKYQGMHASVDPDSEMLIEKLINTTAFADVLPKVQCPVLLIATTQFVRPVDSVKALAEALPKGRFAVLDTGHVASFQSPELVTPLFQAFMTELGL